MYGRSFIFFMTVLPFSYKYMITHMRLVNNKKIQYNTGKGDNAYETVGTH